MASSDGLFIYVGTDRTGRKVRGEIEASSESRAYSLLRAEGISPTSLEDKNKSVMKREIKIPGIGDKVKLKTLAQFAKQFASLIRAGIPILESLRTMAEQTEDSVLEKVLREVYEDVERGLSLSKAMEKHPKAFPALFVAVVASGEEGGFLDEAMESMAKSYKESLELQRKVRGAMTYPIIALAITVLMIIVMMVFVVPKFAEMFESMEVEMPAATQLLITISENSAVVLPVAGVIVAVLVFLFNRYKNEDWLRPHVDSLKLKIPVMGPLLSKLAITKFAKNLAMMLESGVPLIHSLNMVADTANNYHLTAAINHAVEQMKNGHSLAASIDEFGLFPPMVKNMIVIGESSGSLSTMLEAVADFYDDEVKEAAESLTSAIEPVMTLVLGVIIGGVLLALYTPMFSLMGEMSGGGM